MFNKELKEKIYNLRTVIGISDADVFDLYCGVLTGKEKTLIKRIERLEECSHEHNKRELVKCDKCKCLIEKADVIKGKSKIVKKRVSKDIGIAINYWDEETIVKTYYCHRCKK